MSFFRVIYYLLYHRRRRKYQIFFIIFFLLIICYWWIEIYSYEYHIQLIKEKIEIENDQLGRQDEIYLKYLQNPYNINIWNIIQEANKKYQENNEKYLVYSCRFMCGGKKKRKFLFKNY